MGIVMLQRWYAVAGAAHAVVAAVRDEDVAPHRAREAPCPGPPPPRSWIIVGTG
eukprot:COSAG01_NODE_5226_length_4401_cov_5.008601_7_plen_54_part_00